MAIKEELFSIPEGKPCEQCSNPIEGTYYFTVTGRTVCSIGCANLLKSKPEDACYICNKPVFDDKYYATRTKLFCCEQCKNIYLQNTSNDILRKSYPSLRLGQAFANTNKVYEPSNNNFGNRNFQYGYNRMNKSSSMHNINLHKKEEKNYEESRKFYNSVLPTQVSSTKKIIRNSRNFETKAGLCDYCKKELPLKQTTVFFNYGKYCSHECALASFK